MDRIQSSNQNEAEKAHFEQLNKKANETLSGISQTIRDWSNDERQTTEEISSHISQIQQQLAESSDLVGAQTSLHQLRRSVIEDRDRVERDRRAILSAIHEMDAKSTIGMPDYSIARALPDDLIVTVMRLGSVVETFRLMRCSPVEFRAKNEGASSYLARYRGESVSLEIDVLNDCSDHVQKIVNFRGPNATLSDRQPLHDTFRPELFGMYVGSFADNVVLALGPCE